MERFIKKACLFGIISANHPSCIFVVNFSCERVMFGINYETWEIINEILLPYYSLW